jgi:hypothetical protein
VAKKHQIIIPNGRIIIKQEEKGQTGPMSMFVTSDDEKLLQFAKELSFEAIKGCREHAKERESSRHIPKNRKGKDENG